MADIVNGIGSGGNGTISYNPTSFGYVKMFSDIITRLGLKVAAMYLNQYEEPLDKITEINSIFKLIGAWYKTSGSNKLSLNEYATVLTGSIELVEAAVNLTIDIDSGEKSTADISQDVGKIVSQLTTVADKVAKLDTGKSPWFSSIIAACIGLTADYIGSIDGEGIDTKEWQSILKSTIKSISSIATHMVKETIDDSDALTAPLGPIALATSALTGVTTGIFKFFDRIQKYTDDGIPEEIAMKDAIIDGVTKAIKDTANSYTKGADDVAFKALHFLTSFAVWGENQIAALLTGNATEQFNYTPSDKNYMEWIGEIFKTLNVTNSGNSEDNMLISTVNNAMMYGEDGNDYIRNFAFNVTIWGGHDNDTIFSHEDAYNNSMLGGVGADVIVAFDNSSTFYGDSDNDRIAIYGDSNKIYGDDGNDAVLISGAKKNTVNGGAGNDLIILESASNAVIEYGEGDGRDTIFGYEESIRLQVADDDYNTSASGQNVRVNVRGGSLTLVNVRGSTINVNGTRFVADARTTPNTVPSNGIITVPSLWYDNVRTIRGTSLADDINSTVSNVLIEALAGDDSIKSSGNNVSISGGSGNNMIDGGNNTHYVTAGDGNDNVTIGYGYINIIGGNNAISLTDISSSSYGSVPSTVITGDGDDTINIAKSYYSNRYNYGNQIYAGGGNNYINNSSRLNSTITASAGNDTIITGGEYSSINVGDGDNYVSISTRYDHSTSHSTILAGKDDDYINTGSESNNIIISGDGDNTVIAKNNSVIDAGAGNDFIRISSDNTINAGNGDNTIDGGNNQYVTAGNGDDNITIGSGYVNVGEGNNNVSFTDGSIGGCMVMAGDGDDTINIIRSYYHHPTRMNQIYAGGGNNYINNSNRLHSTITANAGNDTILTGGEYSFIDAGDGNNHVIIYTDDVDINGHNTILAGKNDDYVNASLSSGNIIDVGVGNDTIIIGGGFNSINGGVGDNIITIIMSMLNNGSNNTILTSEGNDYISIISPPGNQVGGLHSSDHIIKAGEGKNTIYGGSNTSASVTAGDDDDNITIGYGYVNVGKGNNAVLLTNNSHYSWRTSTVIAGDGNDTIALNNSGSNVMTFDGGNDIIYGYNTSDTIRLNDGHIVGSTIDNSDLILRVGNGSITLKDAKDRYITIVEADGTTSSKVYGNEKIILPDGVKINKAQTTLTVKKPFAGKISVADYSSKVEKINASAVKNLVHLIGNDNDNVIKVGTGGSTLEGGEGSDKLYGNKDGADVFVFDGRGDDIINKYTPEQDIVRIVDGTIDSVKIKGSNVVLSVGDGSLTIKGVAKKELTVIDSDGDTSIYKFTKTNNTLDKALVSANSQMSACNSTEHYWFVQENIVIVDELEPIIHNEFDNELSPDGHEIFDGNSLIGRASTLTSSSQHKLKTD